MISYLIWISIWLFSLWAVISVQRRIFRADFVRDVTIIEHKLR
jgi:hypothetical protein